MFFIFYWRIFTARYLSFLLVAARLDMLSLAVTSYYYFYQVVTDHYFRQFIKHGINIEKIITSTHVYKFQVRSRFRFSNKLLYAYYKQFTRLDWGLNIPIQDLSPPWLIQIILLKKKLDLHKKNSSLYIFKFDGNFWHGKQGWVFSCKNFWISLLTEAKVLSTNVYL